MLIRWCDHVLALDAFLMHWTKLIESIIYCVQNASINFYFTELLV